jgi:hypothetical protein
MIASRLADRPRPRGPTGTSHAHRCARLVPVAPRCAWAPPIGYGDGLTPGGNPPKKSWQVSQA